MSRKDLRLIGWGGTTAQRNLFLSSGKQSCRLHNNSVDVLIAPRSHLDGYGSLPVVQHGGKRSRAFVVSKVGQRIELILIGPRRQRVDVGLEV
jgi:hypothetical protein